MTTRYDDIFNFDIKFWVFIPVYNFEKYIDRCFESVLTQTYYKYGVLIINDGSTDKSSSKIHYWTEKISALHKDVYVITLERNMGPGYTKWIAIKKIIELSRSKNDIFTILDGDDYYLTPYALEIMLYKYLQTKCWFTYGSALGEYTDQAAQITAECIPKLRVPKSDFKYQHPRSCLIFLLDYMCESDFQDESGKWLLRLSDRQFIYKCLELSGAKRVCFIDIPLYNYRSHIDNVRNKVKEDYKLSVDRFINNKEPARELIETIHVIMCCYIRHHNLPKIIESIDNQTVSKRIVFHIINTNPTQWDLIREIRANTTVTNIKLLICNTNENLFGYARFLYTKRLMRSEIAPYVIFFDDDQVLPPTWVETIYNRAEPMTYVCWFGRIFKKNLLKEKVSYWEDNISHESRKKAHYSSEINTFDFGATCGCAIDTNILRLNLLFRCPKKYRNIEDLWLSFIVRQVLGYNIRPFDVPIDIDTFNDTQQTALWVSLHKEKQEFLDLLIEAGFLRSSHINIEGLHRIAEKEDDSELLIGNFVYA